MVHVDVERVREKITSKFIRENSKGWLSDMVDSFNKLTAKGREITKDEIIYLISRGEIVSRSSFFRYKSVLKIIFEEAGIDTSILETVALQDVNTSDKFKSVYYRDFDDVYQTMIFAQKQGYITQYVFETLIASFALLWNGVDAKDLCEIKKSNVSFNKVFVSGKEYDLGLSEAYIIHNYANLDVVSVGVNSTAEEKRALAPSDYLFRTAESSKMLSQAYYRLLFHMNATLKDKIGRQIQTTYLQRSAQMAWIYKQMIIDTSLPVDKAFNCNLPQKWVGFEDTFAQWKEVFYGIKE